MLDRAESRIRDFLLYCVAPIACSIALGFLFYRENVFNRYSGSFQFVSSAVVATVYYYLRLFVRLRDAFLGFLILLVITFLTTGSTQPVYILRDILYVAAIGAAIELYLRFFRSGAHLNVLYPAVALAGLYSLSYLLFSELHLGIIQSSGSDIHTGNAVSLASTVTMFGTLIGAAVGVGISLGDRVFGPAPHRRG